jgi:hypothetical protein
MRRLSLSYVMLAVIALCSACGDDDDDADSGGPKPGTDSGTLPRKDAGKDSGGGSTGLPELAPEWTAIEPGGETICARGDEFRFFVRGGKLNKLLITFDGGGACWSSMTCSFGDALFSPTAEETLPERVEVAGDNTNPENPFRDWYQVFIPYCTADVHWGDSVTTYPAEGPNPEVVINHKGQTNTRAVLDWVYERFEKPDAVFVTGMSAGSYGSIGWAPHVMEHYRDSYVAQLGDCGAGVITDTFFEDSFPAWKADAVIPDWIDGLDVPLSELAIEDLYIAAANHYPNNFFGQYNTDNDENQRLYYRAMGGKDEDWSPKMREKIAAISAAAPTFRSFIAGGVKHVVLPYPEFYSYQADGVRVRDWVADIADGKPVDNVDCGSKCAEAELYQP